MTLKELHTVYRKWLKLDDTTPVDVVLGTVLANRFAGTPVWLFLVGPPGCGKTELLMALQGTDYMCDVGNLTPSALVSGRGKSCGLLFDDARVGGSGKPPYIFTMKDFTTLFGKHEKDQDVIMGQLRQVYDGYYTSAYGVESNSLLEWKGHVGVLAATTHEIELKHTIFSSLGERFVHYKFPMENGERVKTATRAMANASYKKQMQEELQEATMKFLAKFGPRANILTPPAFPKKFDEEVVWKAEFTAHGRTGVKRDKYTGEILLNPSPEVPTRLAQTFKTLTQGIALARGKKSVTRDEIEILNTMARDTMIQSRRKMLEFFISTDKDWLGFSTPEIGDKMNLPTKTVMVRMEDMWCLTCFDRHKNAFSGEGDGEEVESAVTAMLRGQDRMTYYWRISKKFVDVLRRSKVYKLPAKLLGMK